MTKPEPIARIEAALARLGAEHKPPVGWEARVLAAVTKPKPKPWWWFAFPVVALAVIALVVCFPRSPADQSLQLALDIEKGGVVVRGTSAHVGDIVHATATGGGHHRAVWVYRDDHLVVACPGAPQCRRDGEATIADIVLDSTGEYTIVALTSKSPVPAPTGGFDQDVSSAISAGARDVHKSLTVR
jgi:hypothetical protein